VSCLSFQGTVILTMLLAQSNEPAVPLPACTDLDCLSHCPQPPTHPGAATAGSPAHRLLGGQLGFIPQGCPLTVSVVAEESQPSWFWSQEAPEIRGRVTLSNPTQYSVPINNIIVQARSSDGMQYSTTAYCDGGSSTTVPFNPVPYTYGSATCRYRIVLDRRVFGSYGQSGSRRRLQDTGKVQANFFPGSGGDNSGSSGSSSGYGYFPDPSQRPSWTVTAIATIRFSNAQCLSGPTPVNTDCWWNWLLSWHQKHHHKGWFGGRKLMGSAHSDSPSQHSDHTSYLPTPMLKDNSHLHTDQGSSTVLNSRHDGAISRTLLHADSEHSYHSNSGSFGHSFSGTIVHSGGPHTSRRDFDRGYQSVSNANSDSARGIDDAVDTVDQAVDSVSSKADA